MRSFWTFWRATIIVSLEAGATIPPLTTCVMEMNTLEWLNREFPSDRNRNRESFIQLILSCVMERVCSRISEHPLLGTCLGTLQMFWNNQHAKASTEILPPSPEQKERGRCRDDWPVYQHHSDSLWAKSQCFGIVCIKSMYNSGISCCCTQENALQKWSTGWWQ